MRVAPSSPRCVESPRRGLPSQFLVGLAVAVLCWGCSALAPHLQAPRLQVVGVDFLGGNLQHQQLRLRVQVSNPNARPIEVREIDYRLALAGTDVAAGGSDAPFTVPASGQSEFDLNVDSDLGALLRVFAAHLGDAALDYRVSGHVHLAQGVLRELPFTGEGKFALQ